MGRFWNRRRLLQTVGVGLTGLIAGSAGVSAAEGAPAESSVTFGAQTTDGREVVIAEVDAAVDVMYTLSTENHETRYARGELAAGEYRDLAITTSKPIQDDQKLDFSLYPSGGGSRITHDSAPVTVDEDVTFLEETPVTRVDPDPDAGFEYPYFFYAPPVTESEAGGPILVEPNNTGTATDDFEAHERRARELIERGLSRDVSGQLGVPMLVPVFPRPRSEPVDGTHYVHQLDRDTMQQSEGPLERVDLQLLAMVEDAQGRLDEQSYPVDDDVILNGFSASGNFVDRFTVLHPERVQSVTAGGLNGMALLPLEQAKGHTLDFHVGIADVEELTGEPVDLDALNDVDQFLYMGAEDTNDTIPYDDAWTSDELRQTALDVYGEDMINERFPYCQTAYEQAGVEAQFRVYEGVGHTPRPARSDIVEFHRRSIEGEDVGEFGQRLGLEAGFEPSTRTPTAGESVSFDASATHLARGDILAYTWKFMDGETAAGEVVTHAFESSGDYAVTLTVVDSNGRSSTATVDLTVGSAQQEPPTDEPTETPSPTRSTTERSATTAAEPTEDPDTTAESTVPPTRTRSDPRPETTSGADSAGGGGPGFGIGATVASLGGAVALLMRRLRDDSEQ